MSETSHVERHLLIVDDDALTREVLTVVAEEAGFHVLACSAGEEALAQIALGAPVSAVLADMHMPGLCGDALGEQMRLRCKPGTLLVAISASPVPPHARRHYDGFLRKPFQFHELVEVLRGAPARGAETRTGSQTSGGPQAEVLDPRTYAALAASMPAATLQAMYTMCLADADKRLQQMLEAARRGDEDAFRHAAHAIKGGCGMVGALELAAWAGALELAGARAIDDLDPARFFQDATERLRSMLETQTEQPAPSLPARGV